MKKILFIFVLTSLFISLKPSYAIEVNASGGLTLTQTSSSYEYSGDRDGKLTFSSSTNSFSLTDFSEISYPSGGAGATSNAFGIADAPTSGYDATINLISGYGYNGSVDLRDELGDIVLANALDPEPEATPFQPLMRINYDSSNSLIIVLYDSDDAYTTDEVSVLTTGAFSKSVTFTQSIQYSLVSTNVQTQTCAGTGPNCKDLSYWESIEYFGLKPVFTLFPGPNSPVSEPTVFIGIDSFVSFDKG
jgi:hypothetical protein